MYEKYILVSLNPDRPDEPKKPTILPDEPKKPTILFITVLSQSSYFFIIGLDDDLIFGQDESPDCISPDVPESDMPHPEVNLNTFRDENVDEAGPRQSFVVSRQEGLEELKNDILSCYKNSRCRLKAKMRVRFEGENGVGSGPIREFLLSAMKIVHRRALEKKESLSFSLKVRMTISCQCMTSPLDAQVLFEQLVASLVIRFYMVARSCLVYLRIYQV